MLFKEMCSEIRNTRVQQYVFEWCVLVSSHLVLSGLFAESISFENSICNILFTLVYASQICASRSFANESIYTLFIRFYAPIRYTRTSVMFKYIYIYATQLTHKLMCAAPTLRKPHLRHPFLANIPNSWKRTVESLYV